MADLYASKQAKALQMLTKYGAKLEVLDASGTTIDTVMGLMGQLKDSNLPESLTESATALITASVGKVVPDTTHYIKFNNVTYKVRYVDAVNPAGTPIVYSLYVSN